MSLGAGILWSTIVLVIFAVVYLITKAKKWLLVVKTFGVLVFAGAAIGASVWGWMQYRDRPQVIDSLAGVSLGMTPMEVTLALGEPSTDTIDDRPDDRLMLYSESGSTTYIIFKASETHGPQVSIICSSDYKDEVFGLGKYDGEDEIVKKLGMPPVTSVNEDGLEKMMSYPKWKTAFGVKKGKVTEVCISSSGKVSFAKEYQQ
jgi:hypothetical protein